MRFPVSRSQQGMWFLDQLSPGEPTFHIPYAVSLDGPLDASALQRALDAVVARHAGGIRGGLLRGKRSPLT